MYNTTQRRFRGTIVAVEKERVLYKMSVCLALGIQHAMRMRHIVVCSLPRSTIFFHFFVINGTNFEKCYRILNVCFDFLYNFCLKQFSF
jgi:hypothetical protein